jgi:hypothetical protein
MNSTHPNEDLKSNQEEADIKVVGIVKIFYMKVVLLLLYSFTFW